MEASALSHRSELKDARLALSRNLSALFSQLDEVYMEAYRKKVHPRELHSLIIVINRIYNIGEFLRNQEDLSPFGISSPAELKEKLQIKNLRGEIEEALGRVTSSIDPNIEAVLKTLPIVD